LESKKSCHQPSAWYDLTRSKLNIRMAMIERKLKETKQKKNQEKGKKKFKKEYERRKLKRQRVKNKTSRILHNTDQDYGTSTTSKLDGAAKFKPALEILDDLMNSYLAAPFCEPVDPVKYHIPDYFVKIRKPMDLGTVKENVTRGKYKELCEVWADIRLVWENCRTYNGPSNPFTIKANALAQMFEARFERFSKIIPRKSCRRRKRPKRLDDMLNSPLPSKLALREKIGSLSPSKLDLIEKKLAGGKKGIKDKEGNYEINFETMGEETASVIWELLSNDSELWEKNVGENMPEKKESEVKKRLPTPSRRGRQTLTPTGSNWSSKLGNVPGSMALFDMDSKDVFSSSSSSDEDCNIFKPHEKDVQGISSNALVLPKSPIKPPSDILKVDKTCIEKVNSPHENDSCSKESPNKTSDNFNHFKDSHLVDELFS